tara:strand:- start:4379 stop:4609 length:231 start_codon:yes stop_codon:yes gene_type:complete
MNTDEITIRNLASNVEATQVVRRATAAKMLDCHPSFIDKLCHRKELEAVYLGSHAKRITLTSIKQFLSRKSDVQAA